VYHAPPPPPPPPTGRRVATGVGVGTVVAIILVSLLGPVLRGANRKMASDKRDIAASLPAVGSEGLLVRGDGTAMLCKVPEHAGFWGWPCRGEGRMIANGSRVRVMKAAVNAMEGVCRYWVKDGPDNGASGDAPCAWFHAEPGSR